MNGFTTHMTASQTGFPSIFDLNPSVITTDVPMAKLYYPAEINKIPIDNSKFGAIECIAESYSRYFKVSLRVTLTGYTDANNFRFESTPFVYGGVLRKLIFMMQNGIPNVISN